MKHPHAENMRLYAEDAMETDTPWERWEEAQIVGLGWRSLNNNPLWSDGWQYRRKPTTIKRPYIRIGQRWVPEPMREEPAVGAAYFVANLLYRCVDELKWHGLASDRGLLKAGVCHLTREAAEAHLTALQELHSQGVTMLTDEEARK